jgi:hypothetical protein
MSELTHKDVYVLDLIEGPCEVVFRKVNGEERTMVCTLKDSFITKESAGKTKDNPEVATVWDIEKNDWRAFKLDSVISFEPLL